MSYKQFKDDLRRYKLAEALTRLADAAQDVARNTDLPILHANSGYWVQLYPGEGGVGRTEEQAGIAYCGRVGVPLYPTMDIWDEVTCPDCRASRGKALYKDVIEARHTLWGIIEAAEGER